MIEPFMMAVSGRPDPAVYTCRTPIKFKDPNRAISLIPVSSEILSGDRPFYTVEQAKADDTIWKSAIDNTAQIGLRASTENDLISIRSTADAKTPGAAVLLLPGKNRRIRLFQALAENLRSKGKPAPQDCWFVFITPDEILLADKSEYPLTTLKKTVRSIRNQLESKKPGVLLSMEVLEYDAETDTYREV